MQNPTKKKEVFNPETTRNSETTEKTHRSPIYLPLYCDEMYDLSSVEEISSLFLHLKVYNRGS